MNKAEIQTIFGTFIGNKIYASDGSIINCLTYAINRKHIDNQTGFYNIRWSDDVNTWIVFQYIITDN